MAIITSGIDLAKNVFAVREVNVAQKPKLPRPKVPRAKPFDARHVSVKPGVAAAAA